MQKSYLVLKLLVSFACLSLAACSPAPPPAAPQPSASQPAALPAVVEGTQPVMALPSTPTPAPAEVAYTPGAGLPPGLLYTFGAGNGLWLVGADGQPRQLTDGYQPVLSPDGRQVLFCEPYAGDIWVLDLASGEKRNITASPQLNESGYQWWSGNPEAILFYYKPMEQDGISSGSLAWMRTAGEGFQVIDETGGSLGSAAPAPNGSAVALDQSGVPALFRLGQGVQPLALADYGFQAAKAVNPAWSPDGRRLAWVLLDQNNAVGVIDLETGAGSQIHPFSGGGPTLPTLAWSPDGAWLALASWGEGGKSTPVLSVMSPDGAQDFALANGVQPVWSPDGRFLVYSFTPPGAGSSLEDQVFVVESGVWQPLLLPLEPGAKPVGWVRLAP